MRISKLLRSARAEANYLACVALVLLIAKIFFLNRYPVLFLGAYEFGLIVEAVLASVLASYAFYFFVIHLKEASDRSVTQPYIEKHILRIVGDCVSQLGEISMASGSTLQLATIDKDAIITAFQNIDPNSDAPLILSSSNAYANWHQYFSYYSTRSRESIERVLSQIIYVDAELVSLLSAIDDCPHFSQLPLLLSIKIKNKDMTAWASTFSNYCKLCRALNEYSEKKYSRSVQDA